jgi:hypothetical protein
MKNNQKFQGFIAGVMATLLVACLMVPSFAAGTAKTISVLTGISVYKDDSKLSMTDAKGNPVEAFIYNGTTYLPVRAVANAFGSSIQWEGKTYSVYIGKHTSTTPAVMLYNLDFFTGRTPYTVTSDKDNLGNTHIKPIEKNIDNVYKLNGKYTRISGTLFQTYENRSNDYTSTLEIYGDGRLLYSAEMNAGVEPKSFNVDLTGVLELEVNFDNNYMCWSGLGECGLYT